MFSKLITNTCVNVLAPPDPRCSDEAFALANPTICPAVPTLSIEPGVAMVCALGSVQFRVIYTKNGIITDVTDQCVFNTSDPSIVLVGATSGNATGISQGLATVSASYLDLTAYSHLTVLPGTNCCSATEVAMMVLIDTSRSMSLAFSTLYSSRLAFAKVAATRFINEVNTTKDLVGLMTFEAVSDNVLSAPTANTAAVAAMVPGIQQTQQKTSFFQALTDAIAQLNATGAAEQVIVLMSDGEDTSIPYSANNNPISLLTDFKSAGGIVICLGCRASGNGFALLDDFATGGFFINAYPGIEQQSLDYLSGVKGYICAGNCTPVGDTVVHKGQLNYSNFINFNVTNGSVDLQGNNFFDFLPGHGLYVDLAGTAAPQTGLLTTKNAISIVAGHSYRLAVDLSGNQRVNATPESAQLRVYYLVNGTPTYLIDQIVTINDYKSPFTTYAFTFTAPVNASVFISVQQTQQPAGGDPRIGIMMDRVQFQDTTDLTTLFDDNFDDENPVYIPPRCGPGTMYVYLPDLHAYGYAYGYNCYGTGCLDQPPVVQAPDPNPLPDIESGYTPPKEFTSTKTICVGCPSGAVNYPTTSLVPIMTSDTTPSGMAIASGELPGNEAFRVFDNNVPVNSFWQPAATGLGWVGYQFPSAVTLSAYAITCALRGTAPSGFTLDGSVDGMAWTTLDMKNGLNWADGETKDFLLPTNATYQFFRLNVTSILGGTGLVNFLNVRKLYLYAPVPAQACSTKTATSSVSQADADSQATALATADAQSQLNCRTVYTATEAYTAKCGPSCFGASVTKSDTESSLNSLQEAQDLALAEATALANDALDCTGSNNDQQITINDATATPSAATPYPSVKFVQGRSGTIVKVTVTINGLTHASPHDIHMIIQSPAGTVVELMRNVAAPPGSNGCSGLTITFDDSAGSPLPASGALSSGTFQCSDYGPVLPLNPPAPQPPYATSLSAFIGENPNGCWSLWVIDAEFLDSGFISLGFEV